MFKKTHSVFCTSRQVASRSLNGRFSVKISKIFGNGGSAPAGALPPSTPAGGYPRTPNSNPLHTVLATRLSGVMRVGGRISSSDLPFEAKHPALLSKHDLSEVLMRHFHLICKHQGVEYTLAVCRESIWLIGGRRMLRSVKAKCVTCRKFAAKCADEQSAPLPED